MSYDELPIKYPARWDYGSRRGYPTLGVIFHMAEGTNVASYLVSETRAGVSVHYTIEQATSRFSNGEIQRILPENRISGSVNPNLVRRTNDSDGYYGVRHNRFALGAYWSNPNVAVITVEVAGRAKDGPTHKQMDSMVALFEDIERRYDRVVPLGHRDFADYKACPGKTDRIKLAFDRMGGHGKRYDSSEERRFMSTRGFVPGRVCDVQAGAKMFNYPGGKAFGATSGDNLEGRYLLGYSPAGREYALVETDIEGQGQRTAWVKADQVANVRPVEPVDPADCTESKVQARAVALEEAEAAVAAIER